jgi:hypothetical protein
MSASVESPTIQTLARAEFDDALKPNDTADRT